MFGQREIRRHRDPERLQRVEGRARVISLASDKGEEVLYLRRVRLQETFLEVRVGCFLRGRNAGFDGAQGGAPVNADGDAVIGAEDLGPHVVAEGIMAASREDGEDTVLHPDQGRRSIHVAVFGEEVEVADASSGVDVLYFAAGQPAQNIEVVDVEVAEDAA